MGRAHNDFNPSQGTGHYPAGHGHRPSTVREEHIRQEWLPEHQVAHGAVHLALVFNPTTRANGSGRVILAIATSKDQGFSWPRHRILEQTDSSEHAYPTLASDLRR